MFTTVLAFLANRLLARPCRMTGNVRLIVATIMVVTALTVNRRYREWQQETNPWHSAFVVRGVDLLWGWLPASALDTGSASGRHAWSKVVGYGTVGKGVYDGSGTSDVVAEDCTDEPGESDEADADESAATGA